VVLTADGRNVLVASVSDGAGSASQSEFGAKLVVSAFQTTFGAAAREEPDLRFLDRSFILVWLAKVQEAIRRRAEEDGFQPRDYACTFLGTVVGDDAAGYVQIGDGAIVVADIEDDEDVYSWVFWPQHGEFANSTFFITMENAAEIIQFEKCETSDSVCRVREVAMFSDGLERLVLDMTARTVHSPSLRPILDWLATTDPVSAGQPSEVLAAYLNSPHVNRRTDDDKTLVMATRAMPLVKEPQV